MGEDIHKSPLVSVLMPVYNAEKFLRQALDSVLGQTFRDFEVIIINDGSKDNSEEIILSYSDLRIKYHNRSNKGVAATLNEGIGLATGKYIMRHDADDISLPARLQEQVDVLEGDDEVLLCSYQVAFMTERGKVAWGYKQPADEYFEGKPHVVVQRKHFNTYCPITHGTVLVRTQTMRDLGGYRDFFITSEDVDIWLRLIQNGKAIILHKVLSYHRLSASSITQVHGWKNRFYKELALRYFDQREKDGQDDLQAGKRIDIPLTDPYAAGAGPQSVSNTGAFVDNSILLYKYPLAVNAGDFKESFYCARALLKQGWNKGIVWKGLVMPLLGEKIVGSVIKLKQALRK